MRTWYTNSACIPLLDTRALDGLQPSASTEERAITQKTDFRPVLPISAIRHPCNTQRGPLTVASSRT